MKKCFFLLGLLTCLISCEDRINLKNDNKNVRLAVYCFPTGEDSLDIGVSSAQGIAGQPKELKDVRVSCILNGKPFPAVFVKNMNEKSGIPMKLYRMRHAVRQGDVIGVRVETAGFLPVTSMTTVPVNPTISGISLDTLFIKGEWYVQIRCGIRNSPQKDFYAVRILGQEDWTEVPLSVRKKWIHLKSQSLITIIWGMKGLIHPMTFIMIFTSSTTRDWRTASIHFA
jgi:hypothetical protein